MVFMHEYFIIIQRVDIRIYEVTFITLMLHLHEIYNLLFLNNLPGK